VAGLAGRPARGGDRIAERRMIPLGVGTDGRPLRVLCLGAHCDDIEIGCGGTLLALRAARPDVEIRWHVLTSDAEREAELRASAVQFGIDPTSAAVRVDAFRDGFLPYEGPGVKEAVHTAHGGWRPDLVFTHARHDRHQDHRLISDLTWNAYRDQLVLEYEIPKWDGDLGAPNFFVALPRALVERKLGILESVYASQRSRASFDLGAFRGLMALRGVECRADEGHAEAFYARKLVFHPAG